MRRQHRHHHIVIVITSGTSPLSSHRYRNHVYCIVIIVTLMNASPTSSSSLSSHRYHRDLFRLILIVIHDDSITKIVMIITLLSSLPLERPDHLPIVIVTIFLCHHYRGQDDCITNTVIIITSLWSLPPALLHHNFIVIIMIFVPSSSLQS